MPPYTCRDERWTLAELLERFVAANEHWRPATRSSHTSMARFLTADPVGKLGLAVLSPDHVEAAMSRWRSEEAWAALVWARWAVLRSALSWAAARGVIRSNPLEVMKGPPRPQPRKHLLLLRSPPCWPPPGYQTPPCTACVTVGTHRVSEGKLLKAQGRLVHRDPVTTLRHYAHATPLDDQDVADDLDACLNRATRIRFPTTPT